MSTFDAQDLMLQNLLGHASEWQILIPQFQRGYSWEKSHYSTFWDDLQHFLTTAPWQQGENYFLGPVVYIRGNDGTYIELLDGQQRLLTATILLSVIRDVAGDGLGQEGADLARDIQRDFILKEHEDAEKLALIPSEIDREYFNHLIQNSRTDRQLPPARVRSCRLIRGARSFFKSNLGRLLEGKTNREKLVVLQSIKRVLTRNFKVAAIRVESTEQAYQIFETLNDRGLRLSPADLLLNFLLQQAATAHARDSIKLNWNRMTETLGMKQPSQFLRHMWTSRYGDVKSVPLYRAIRDHVINQRVTPEALAETCRDESEIYVRLINIDGEFFNNDATRAAGRGLLKYYGAGKALPLFLSAANLSPEYFGQIVLLVERLFVRYVIVADGNPSVLEDTLYHAATTVREMNAEGQRERQIVSAVAAEFAALDPSDDAIRAGVVELNFDNSNSAKYFVRSVADQIHNLPARYDNSEVDLEHVFPENATEENWPNYQELEPLVWHLGNLTSLEKRLNRRAGNSPYAEKRPIFRESQIQMTTSLAEEYDVWTPDTVRRRAESLVEYILARWPHIE